MCDWFFFSCAWATPGLMPPKKAWQGIIASCWGVLGTPSARVHWVSRAIFCGWRGARPRPAPRRRKLQCHDRHWAAGTPWDAVVRRGIRDTQAWTALKERNVSPPIRFRAARLPTPRVLELVFSGLGATTARRRDGAGSRARGRFGRALSSSDARRVGPVRLSAHARLALGVVPGDRCPVPRARRSSPLVLEIGSPRAGGCLRGWERLIPGPGRRGCATS